MRFIGTGAGEGTPNPFCRCPVCENARKVGGKEIRTRSSFKLDNKTIIDIGADFFAQSFRLNEPFCDVEHVLYTHTHDDHFNYTMIWERFVRRSEKTPPLNIYFTDSAYDILDKFYLTSPVTDGREGWITEESVKFAKLEFQKTYEIGNYSVTPLRGDHATVFEKNSANFLVENKDFSLFYAVDSGPFLKETVDFLEGKGLDYFIGECTFPDIRPEATADASGHMNAKAFVKNLLMLLDKGIIRKDTKIYATHISPFVATHEQLENYFNSLDLPFEIIVAYDGLEVE